MVEVGGSFEVSFRRICRLILVVWVKNAPENGPNDTRDTPCGILLHPPRARSWLVVFAFVLVWAGHGIAYDQPPLLGLTLPQALDELRNRGLTIISSSALVTEQSLVETEPTGVDPRSILEQVLAQHGLAVHQGPHGQLVVVLASNESAAQTGSISGGVQLNSAARRQIVVRVVGSDLESTVAGNGRFLISGVAPGLYAVEASSPGSVPRRIDNVSVHEGQDTPLVFHLEPPSVFLNEIVVTPSHFRILEREPENRTFLSAEDVARMPHVADDLFRAVKRLPGAASGDVSATFNVRGGEQEELLVILDGVELYEPFHLKDFQSVFSVIDTEVVGGVDFLTGGFPVEYGDRMSGVMDISTTTPEGPPVTSLALSSINARIVSEGSFHDGRGQWLVNGRVWYPEKLAARVTDTAHEILTDYYDVLTKIQHRVGEHSILSANLLLSYDDLGFAEADEESLEAVVARYQSHQEWLNLRTDWTEQLFSQTVLSAGQVKRRRIGGAWDVEDGTLDIEDLRRIDFYALKQDWTWELGDRHFLKWGVEARREDASYDYWRRSVDVDSDPGESDDEQVLLDPKGTSYGAYAADRFRLTSALVAEIGLRWDRQFYVGQHQLSPRLNIMYEITPNTTFRAAWGRFFQSQRLNELQVEDGESEFHPAQLSEHSTISLEHRFGPGLALRLEVYRKRLSDLRPRYENLFNPIELFPEGAPDRVRVAPESGRAEGVEILLRSQPKDAIDWWLSYGLSRAEDRIDGVLVARSWDQRHAASAGFNWRFGNGWNLNLAGSWHTGWPTTEVLAVQVVDDEGEVDYELVLGPRNEQRLPSYLRFDLRASRSFATDYGEVRVFLEAVNLSSRKNICCLDDFEAVEQDDGSVVVQHKETYWAPIIPSLGVSWRF